MAVCNQRRTFVSRQRDDNPSDTVVVVVVAVVVVGVVIVDCFVSLLKLVSGWSRLSLSPAPT